MVDLFGRGRLSFSDMLKNLSVARKTLLKKITAEPAVVWISSYKLQSARFKLEPHHCLFFMAGGQVCCQCSGTGCLCWAAGIFLFPLLAQLAAAARAIYR